jgi:hypothetical protein
MARPKKNNADYFSHDADMRNDNKIKALRRKFGLTGYAVYSMLLEHLTDCDFFEFEDNDLNIELISGDFDVEPSLLNEIFDYLKLLKLISRKDGKIFSQKLKDRFESLLNKRTRQKTDKELKRAKTEKEIVVASENPQSKVKESKVKESKEKEIEKDLTPFELIQKEKPSQLESWEMGNRKNVNDYKDLVEAFNNTAGMEIIADNKTLEFDSAMLILRFKNFANAWIRNQKGAKVVKLEQQQDPDYVYYTTQINSTVRKCHKDKWPAFKANEELGGRIFTIVDYEERARLRADAANKVRYAN